MEENNIDKKNKRIGVVRVKLEQDMSLLSKDVIDTPLSVLKVVGEFCSEMDRETMGIIHLKANGEPININFASVGTLENTPISIKEMLKASILSNTSKVIFFHNHPSGDLTPSKDDIYQTQRLIEAYHLLDIEVLDHVIFGGERKNDYYSMDAQRVVNFNDYEVTNQYVEVAEPT